MRANRRNQNIKDRKHYSGVSTITMAFIAFVAIGSIISFSIRACNHPEASTIIDKQLGELENDRIGFDRGELSQEKGTHYAMPDSIIQICMAKPIEGIPEQILRRASYVTSYNKYTKIPNWVAWHLTAEQTDGPYKRLSNFHEDEDVPMPRATLSDYRGSGWSRGHMCPAGDNKWDEKAMYDSFSLINVCPQNSSLNSGLWNSIEMDCRKWACQYGDIYIVCGPVLMRGNYETIGEHEVVVPEAFFKVVLCLNGKPKAFGFIVRNTDGNKKRDLYYNSVDQVERITGIDFFPALPDDIEDEVEANANIKDWK